MTHDPSRKRFLAKVLGLAAAGALAPRAAAREVAEGKGGDAGAKRAAFKLQSQARAVARREDPA